MSTTHGFTNPASPTDLAKAKIFFSGLSAADKQKVRDWLTNDIQSPPPDPPDGPGYQLRRLSSNDRLVLRAWVIAQP